jgi:hypothetical protein
MRSAAHLTAVAPAGSWRVTRDGASVAVVALRREAGEVVVAVELTAAPSPGIHRFASLPAAETFVDDLNASFSYLGCDVARS